MSRRPHRSALAALTLLAAAAAPAASAAGFADFGPPRWADSGAAFAPRPPRPARVALLAPRPAARAAVTKAPVVARRRASVVSFGWLSRGGLAVHPRRSVRIDVATLPSLPSLPAIAAVPAEAPAARPVLVAAKPRVRGRAVAVSLPPAPAVPAGPGGSALERFLRSTAPGTWGGADAVRRTAAKPAAAPAAPVVR